MKAALLTGIFACLWLCSPHTVAVTHSKSGIRSQLSSSVLAREESRKESPIQTAEGVFLGIEEGDYPHWQMKTADGKELSFFILKSDATIDPVLERPKRFKGRRCRVQWKRSKEDIPEAGGKIELEQVLSVEWLDKK